ncbi:hypothetical protein TNCV_1457181 [Trichonephila clavipes]|nr:hypothetical protein TNCV_1457181 [Trichonephila clavipes]
MHSWEEFKTMIDRDIGLFTVKSVDMDGRYCDWRCLGDVIGDSTNNCLSFREGLREADWSNRRIGRSDMVVAPYCQQWIMEGIFYHLGGLGRPRNTNTRDNRTIIRRASSSLTTSLE